MMRRFTKMQLNLKGDDELTLDDMIASMNTAHVAANAFYCCLGACALANMGPDLGFCSSYTLSYIGADADDLRDQSSCYEKPHAREADFGAFWHDHVEADWMTRANSLQLFVHESENKVFLVDRRGFQQSKRKPCCSNVDAICCWDLQTTRLLTDTTRSTFSRLRQAGTLYWRILFAPWKIIIQERAGAE